MGQKVAQQQEAQYGHGLYQNDEVRPGGPHWQTWSLQSTATGRI